MHYSLAMQNVEDVNKIVTPTAENEAVQEESRITISLSWPSVQLILCIIIVCSLIAIKQFTPELYDKIINEYSNYVEELALIEDGSIILVDEK